jgi:hypothetical protein
MHSKMSAMTPRRRFGGWPNALRAAGLKENTFEFPEEIPLERLAPEFLNVVKELSAIPSLHQLSRRSTYGRWVFSVKFGKYADFKKAAICLLLADESSIPSNILPILKAEYGRLAPDVDQVALPQRAHEHGRVLGFRSLAHVPTYEMEVVTLFSMIADELGFEITCNRGEFPDCEANRRTPGKRRRYRKCLIEFELRSSDFLVHKHPVRGCDLVVCWEHDWPECPIEVLELREKIKKLPGWK